MKKKSDWKRSDGHCRTVIQMAGLMAKGSLGLVAVDGMTATGKTAYAKELQSKFDVDVLHADDLPGDSVEDRVNAIREAIVKWVKNGEGAKNVCVVEGCYTLHPKLERYFDIRVCMNCPEEIREQRLLERGKKYYASYQTEILPREEQYFVENNILRSCKNVVES